MELDLTGIHKLAAEQGIDPETLDDALAEASKRWQQYYRSCKYQVHPEV